MIRSILVMNLERGRAISIASSRVATRKPGSMQRDNQARVDISIGTSRVVATSPPRLRRPSHRHQAWIAIAFRSVPFPLPRAGLRPGSQAACSGTIKLGLTYFFSRNSRRVSIGTSRVVATSPPRLRRPSHRHQAWIAIAFRTLEGNKFHQGLVCTPEPV
jgi:hypothetical protein